MRKRKRERESKIRGWGRKNRGKKDERKDGKRHGKKKIKWYKEVELYINKILCLKEEINNVKNVNELMGIEGNIHKIYYSAWNIIINQNINFMRFCYYQKYWEICSFGG